MASIGDGDGGVNDKVSEPLQHTNGKEVELNAELSQINTNKCVPNNLHGDHEILTRLGSWPKEQFSLINTTIIHIMNSTTYQHSKKIQTISLKFNDDEVTISGQ
ncbi:hypothetical protein P8452_08817 [Trifolium repens]|jgi:hypothetical protein|nr:hypothetical protein P8452_08817 [Trifolium repens]